MSTVAQVCAEIGAVGLALQRALEAEIDRAITNSVQKLRWELKAEISAREKLSEKVTILETAVRQQLRQEFMGVPAELKRAQSHTLVRFSRDVCQQPFAEFLQWFQFPWRVVLRCF